MSDSPEEPPASSYMTTLPESRCYELLAVATVGRIGFASADGMQIFPVDFRLGDGPRLFLSTSPQGAVARLAEAGTSVAFEVDYHASDFGIAWSVLMNGTLSVLDPAARESYDQLRVKPVPWPGLTDPLVIQFMPEKISGRGLHRI